MNEADFFAELLGAAFDSGREFGQAGEPRLCGAEVYDLFEPDILGSTDTWLDHLENTTTLYFTAEGRTFEYEKTFDAVLDEWNRGYDDR